MLTWNRRSAAGRIVLRAGMSVLVIVLGEVAVSGQTESSFRQSAATKPVDATTNGLEQATFGAGCFWCSEAVFERLEGVYAVVSGYSGGHVRSPSYKQVATGMTGHAEVVHIVYNPQVISYTDLLHVFWKTHDPTTPNRQGMDVGPQYRSVIFFHSDEQRRLATEYKRKLAASGAFDGPIVTEITPFEAFYPAENYHQAYYEKNGRQPYCQRVIRPKMAKLAKLFPDQLKKKPADIHRIRKTNAQWKAQLTDLQYAVTRKKKTEPAFTGKYWNSKEKGTYKCACCGLPLYDSATKYNPGCGWPSFWAPINANYLATAIDRSMPMVRTELKCARCGAHLGHVFADGPAPTGVRHCINSAALKFEKAAK